MPTPQEASSRAASVTAHQGSQPPPPQAPSSRWRRAVPWTSAPRNSLKGAVCPWTAKILSPGHQGKQRCQGTPQQRSSARKTKSPGPGGRSGRPTGHHRMPGWKGRPDTAQAGGRRPGSKDSAAAAVGQALPVTSACRPGAHRGQGPPKARADSPSSRQGVVLSTRGVPGWALSPHYAGGTPKDGEQVPAGPVRATLISGPTSFSVTAAARPPSVGQGAVSETFRSCL